MKYGLGKMKKFQITNSKLQTIYNTQIPNYKQSSQELSKKSFLQLASKAIKISFEMFVILVIVIWDLFVICDL